jgi:hypothetical protein
MKAARSYALALVMMLFVSTYLTAAPARPAPHRRAVLTASDPIAGEYVVILAKPIAAKDVAPLTASLGTRYHAQVVSVWKDAVQGFWGRMSKENAAALANDRRVESVEENARFYTSANPPTSGASAIPKIRGPYPIDPTGHPLWHLTRISHRSQQEHFVTEDFSYPYLEGVNDGTGATVYVIDSGVNRYHQEFFSDDFVTAHPAIANDDDLAPLTIDTPRLVDLPGANVTTDNLLSAAEPHYPCGSASHWFTQPNIGHGTACGSLVGGRNVGVARGAKIVPVKVIGCGDFETGASASTASLISGVDFVVVHERAEPSLRGAVISMSTFRSVQGSACPGGSCIGGQQLTQFENAIESALNAGITVVASANNQHMDACEGTPARLSRHGGKGRVITVGGLAKGADNAWVQSTPDEEAGSNVGQCVDIWAPAQNIESAAASDWFDYRATAVTGTSFSAPIVAGIVARLLSEDPALNTRDSATVDKVWTRLAETATHAERMNKLIDQDSTSLIAYVGATTVRQTETHSGQQTTFTVYADFLASAPGVSNVTYAWYQGEPGDRVRSTSLSGSTPSYTTAAGETGTYWARVSFEFDGKSLFADSPGSTIAACDLTISAQPHDLWIDGSSGAQLTVTAAGASPRHYTWYRGYPPDMSTPLPGDSDSLIVSDQQADTQRYWVRVTAGGCTVNSTVALVRLCRPATPFTVTAQPALVAPWQHEFVFNADGPAVPNTLYRWFRGPLGDEQNPLGTGLAGRTVSVPLSGTPSVTVWASAVSPCGAEVRSWNAATAAACTPPTLPAPLSPRRILPGQSTILWARTENYDPTTDEITWHVGQDDTEIGRGPALPIRMPTREQNASPNFTLSYKVIASRSGCTADSRPIVVSRANDGGPGCGNAPIMGALTKSRTGATGPWLLAVAFPESTDRTIFSAEWRSGAEYDDLSAALPGSTFDQHSSSVTVNSTGPAIYWVRLLYRCTLTSEYVYEDSAQIAVDFPNCLASARAIPNSVRAGEAIRLVAAGSAPDLTYTWYEGPRGSADSSRLLGTTASVYIVPAAPFTTYWVRVQGSCGIEDSAAVTVTCSNCAPPTCPTPSVSIITSPQSGHINHSLYPTLIANGTGTGLVYNWYRGAAGQTDRFEATAPAISPYVPGPFEHFWVRAIDACGHTADAVPVTISICVPAITQQPAPTTIDAGEDTILSVAADSANASPLTYQWYTGAQSQTLFPVAGGTGATLHVHPTATTQYWVAVTGSCSDGSAMVESAPALVTVRACVAPAINAQPQSKSIAEGDSVTMTVGATGTNLTYQWYEDAGTGNPVAGATSASLTAWPPYPTSYWCRVSGTCGTVDSAPAEIDVCSPPGIDVQPQSGTINSGSSTTLSVTPYLDLNAGPIAYHWYQGMVGDKSTPVGSDSPTFTTPALTATIRYWVALTTGACETASQQATISICALPAVAPTGTTSVRKNQSVTLTLSPNPGTSGISYQWYRGASGNTASPIAGATSASATVTVATTGDYWCRVTSGSCTVNSSALTVSVCIPTITTQPVGGSLANGQTLTLTVATDLPSSTYQWYRGASGNTSSPVTGATAASYTAGAGPTTSYWVRVTGTCGTSTDSNAATVNCVTPSISSSPAGAAITRGQTVNLTVGASGTGLTYQWYQGAGTASPYGGATSATLTATPQVSTAYWCRVTGSCGTADSALAQVDVCSAPVLSTQPQSQTINSGQTASLSVSVQANALNPASHYHWYRGALGDRSSPVGGDSATFTTPALTAATSYWVAVNAGTCETASAQATISMCALPAVTATGPTSIQKGQVITLSLSPNPGTSGITYQWYEGASGNTASPIGSATAYAVTVQPQATTSYWCRVTNATCSVNSTAVTANVCIPRVTTDPIGTTNPIANGQTWTMTVATDVGASTCQWYRGTPGDTSSPVAGATAASLTVNPSVTTTYFARVTGPCGYYADSAAATVTVCVLPTISGHPTGASITRGQTVNLTVTAAGTGLTYQWYQGAGTGSPYGGGNAATLTTASQVPTAYWCRVTGSCGTADSQPAQVDVCATPVINAQPQSQTVADGGTANLSVTATQPTGLAKHYQWYRSTAGNPINPVGDDLPTYTTAAITAETSYFVRITSGNCSLDSNTATISTCPLPVMQTIGGGNVPRYQTLHLRVIPAPEDVTFTFYEGPVGDTSNFVGGGGIQSMFTISASHNAQYWARVDNGICQVDTAATTVTVY